MSTQQDFTKPETFHSLAVFKTDTDKRLRDVTCIALALVFEHLEASDPGTQQVLEDCAQILAPLGAYGVEGFNNRATGTVQYVNLGDPYLTTVLVDDDGEFLIADWGTHLEVCEEEHTFDTGEMRCAYCGEWTDGPCHNEDGTVWKAREYVAGDKVLVTRASKATDQPASAWIPEAGETVELLEDATAGGWDVYDVKRADGTEDTVYGFNLPE